jgi:hypothetical protein
LLGFILMNVLHSIESCVKLVIYSWIAVMWPFESI